MAMIKCKMCGGDLRLIEGSTVCECEYCGTKQTVPSMDNEKKLTLFSRAGRLLRGCEFDKAAGVFETIVADFPEEAEAYWGLVLCKYGIEYVDDPATGKKIPTCHRSSFESVLDDPNYEQACENTDALARRVYRDEARQIEELRQAILQVSGKEEPYEVFISYKETDEKGERTLDSVIAQDIYTELTERGHRTFFSRISLEDKLGTEYEPYIFAALNSAKVMLVVGTDYENFDSVWVKNEWSRFLKLIAAGQKKTLIPVFKNMDAYDMPKEFAKLTAQDMGKVGAMQDLVRGVEKLIGKKDEAVKETVKETVVVQQSGGPNVTALLKRGQQALEDGEWDKAKSFYDQVLSMDAENAEAFFGLFLADAEYSNEAEYIETVCVQEAAVETLSIAQDAERIKAATRQYTIAGFLSENQIRSLFQSDLSYPSALNAWKTIKAQEDGLFKTDRNLVRAVRYAKGDAASRPIRFKAELSAALEKAVREAQEQERTAEENKRREYVAFLADAEEKLKSQYREAQERQEANYQDALQRFAQAKNLTDYQSVRECFVALTPYKDSEKMVALCDEKLVQIKKAEAEEAERQAERKRIAAEKAARKRKRTIAILTPIVLACIAFVIVLTTVIIPKQKLNRAMGLLDAGDYEAAYALLEEIGDNDAIASSKYDRAIALIDAGDYEAAYALLEEIGDNDAIASSKYDRAIALIDAGDYEAAYILLNGLNYKDSVSKLDSIKLPYKKALLSKAQVGSWITFGSYEQDNNTVNGKEDIEWQVLEKDGNRILVISRYALDCQQYNTSYTSVTWETCSLRKWLNGTFLNAAFSAEEQAMIPSVSVSADKNPSNSTSPGNSTTDQVFLLSITEANKYFSSDEARKCAPTDYADVWTSDSHKVDGRAACWWWLRSPGGNSNYAACVNSDGPVGDRGSNVNDDLSAVRPAMWIQLGS